MTHTLTTRPVAPACGSFVEGLDVKRATDSDLAALSQLLAEPRGERDLVLRRQVLIAEEHDTALGEQL